MRTSPSLNATVGTNRYGFMASMPATGIAMGYYGGKGVPFFGLYTFPGKADKSKEDGKFAGQMVKSLVHHDCMRHATRHSRTHATRERSAECSSSGTNGWAVFYGTWSHFMCDASQLNVLRSAPLALKLSCDSACCTFPHSAGCRGSVALCSRSRDLVAHSARRQLSGCARAHWIQCVRSCSTGTKMSGD